MCSGSSSTGGGRVTVHTPLLAGPFLHLQIHLMVEEEETMYYPQITGRMSTGSNSKTCSSSVCGDGNSAAGGGSK